MTLHTYKAVHSAGSADEKTWGRPKDLLFGSVRLRSTPLITIPTGEKKKMVLFVARVFCDI